MFHLLNMLLGGSENMSDKITLSKEEIADLLKTDPEALQKFEESYENHVLKKEDISDNFFEINAKQITKERKKYVLPDISPVNQDYDIIIQRIISELLEQAAVYHWDGKHEHIETFDALPDGYQPVTMDDLKKIPEEYRPELTGQLYKKDIAEDTASLLLYYYKMYLESKDKKVKKHFYDSFRRGLDMLDIDPLTYKIIDRNQNSMGYWLPAIVDAVKDQDFFKIPDTKILKVPLSLLQLTRQEYTALTPATMRIVDEFCYKAFGLEPDKEYFIKTGTYSSKFDFRNAHVVGEKEVKELGEYLLFIHFQALCHAHYDLSGREQPAMYGISTTTEWVVREYIQPPAVTPEIYYGLPLRPEYRLFVDFDTDEILGISPYWEPNMMKKRFGHAEDSENPDKVHDYIIYCAMEEELMKQYMENKDTVIQKLRDMLPRISLTGQWSLDVMQNGSDFYIIDMALAENSALNECVPDGLLKSTEEDWMPRIGG